MSARRAESNAPDSGPAPGKKRTGAFPAPPAPALSVAGAAQLHYVSSSMPGIRRRRRGKRFIYLDPEGIPVRDPAEIARINQLAIPPAYEEVWVCPDPLGHLQATGRDARGRKQYRYHPRWVAARNADKYCRMIGFGRALPKIRAALDADLARPGLSANKVMATIVALLDRTAIRVGNPRYARENDSFGLTTLENRHVDVHGHAIRFQFRGKSGVEHDLELNAPRLARILNRCQELPGQQLFQYQDADGEPTPVTSSDINAYLRTHGGGEFSAKDFRTWAGSVLALALLRTRPWQDNAAREVTAAVAEVAAQLGNTAAVCRKGYIHPAIIDAFVTGELASWPTPRKRQGLSQDESGLLKFLESHPRVRCA